MSMISKILEDLDLDLYSNIKELQDEECEDCSDNLDISNMNESDCEDCNCGDCDDNLEEDFESEIQAILNEVSSSTVRMTKRRKIKAAAGLASLRLAKKKKDAQYEKYKKHRQRALAAKKKIMNRYRSKGMRSARKAMR